jgi:mannose-6-phosphate isomerase
MKKFYPIFFKPVYKNYLWGGTKIRDQLQRKVPSDKIAESWEISDHKDGMSYVENGEWKNYSLSKLLEELGEDLIGKEKEFSRFPLLIKIIDAEKDLSVQVHPDDYCAKKYGGEAKTEAWYALPSDLNASVFVDFKKGIEKEDLLRAIEEKELDKLLRHYPISEGDIISIPGGTVHAICSGSLLLEVQQNSNVTYRLYDWNRVDKNGLARPLHIKEALNVLHIGKNKKPITYKSKSEKERIDLLETDYFLIEEFHLNETYDYEMNHKSFHIIFFLEGEGKIKVDDNEEEIIEKRSYLIPAGASSVSFIPSSEKLSFLRISLPD